MCALGAFWWKKDDAGGAQKSVIVFRQDMVFYGKQLHSNKYFTYSTSLIIFQRSNE